jgi:hypothetical protein
VSLYSLFGLESLSLKLFGAILDFKSFAFASLSALDNFPTTSVSDFSARKDRLFPFVTSDDCLVGVNSFAWPLSEDAVVDLITIFFFFCLLFPYLSTQLEDS